MKQRELQTRPVLPALADRRIADMLMRQAEARADALFLRFVSQDATWTYGEMATAAAKCSQGLRSLGLEVGDRVGIMLGNCQEYIVTWFGSLFAGTIDVAINHSLKGALLRHQLVVSGVVAVVCDADGKAALDEVAADVPQLRTIIVLDPMDVTVASSLRIAAFGELLANPPANPVRSAAKDTSSIRYTSGTTGAAKAIALTQSRIIAMATHFVWLTGYDDGDRLYTCFPLHHGMASGLGVITTLIAGGSAIIDGRFSASNYWRQIRRHKATLAHILNPLVPILLAQPPTESDRDHGCTRLWTAIPNRDFEARFGPRLIYFYGQSEGNAIAFTPPGETAPPLACGRPSPFFDVRICDEDDYPVPPRVTGQILWRPNEPHIMMPGYFGDPEATVAAWQNLWFHSGDEGFMDEAGYLYLVGRMGDQIRRKGVNIAAVDIETVALEFEGVREAAAIAVPADVGESEALLAITTVGTTFNMEAFLHHLRRGLPPDMVPRYVDVRESLPRTDTYKVSKAQMRGEWTRGERTNVMDLHASSTPMHRPYAQGAPSGD